MPLFPLAPATSHHPTHHRAHQRTRSTRRARHRQSECAPNGCELTDGARTQGARAVGTLRSRRKQRLPRLAAQVMVLRRVASIAHDDRGAGPFVLGSGGRCALDGSFKLIQGDLAVAIGIEDFALLELTQQSDNFSDALGVGLTEQRLELAVGLELCGELLPVDGAAPVFVDFVEDRLHLPRDVRDIGAMLRITGGVGALGRREIGEIGGCAAAWRPQQRRRS